MSKFIFISKQQVYAALLILSVFGNFKVFASSDAQDPRYVYTRTRSAVLEDEKGRTVLRLYLAAKLKIVAISGKDNIEVQVEGWVRSSKVKKGSQGILQKYPLTTVRIWRDPPQGGLMYYEAIGDMTDETQLSEVGLSRILPGGKYIKVRLQAWVQRKYVTENKAETELKGKIHGRLLRNGQPAKGIPVSIAGRPKTYTDNSGIYSFKNLFPGREYKVYFHIGIKAYYNLYNYPVLDPGEELNYGELDIAPYEK